MAQVHISEAELARDLHAVLEKVRQGAEVIVERNHQPLAVLRAAYAAAADHLRLHRAGRTAR